MKDGQPDGAAETSIPTWEPKKSVVEFFREANDLLSRIAIRGRSVPQSRGEAAWSSALKQTDHQRVPTNSATTTTSPSDRGLSTMGS